MDSVAPETESEVCLGPHLDRVDGVALELPLGLDTQL